MLAEPRPVASGMQARTRENGDTSTTEG